MGVAEIEGSRGLARWSDRALVAESLIGRPDAGGLLWARHESAAADLLSALGRDRTRRSDLAGARALFDAQAAELVWSGTPVREAVITLTARVATAAIEGPAHESRPADVTSLVQAYRLLPVDERSLIWYLAVDRLPAEECVPMLPESIIGRAPEVVRRFASIWISVSRGRGLAEECAQARSRLLVDATPGAALPAHVHARSCVPCAAVIANRNGIMERLSTLLLDSILGSQAAARLREGSRSVVEASWPPPLRRPVRPDRDRITGLAPARPTAHSRLER